jgi:hypothetical protein
VRFGSGLSLVAALVLAGSCGSEREKDDSSEQTTTLSSATDETGIGEVSGPDEKLDVLGETSSASNSGGDQMSDGCKKVDLLFVIDDSGSMADEQENLVASFPMFIDGIRTQLADTSGYHIGIINSSIYIGDTTCLPLQEGTMVTQTAGVASSNSVCGPYAEGHRYMTEMDNLENTFACAAQLGSGGDGNERPMQTMQAALSQAQVGPGGCNEGFLRDDALLVVVIITDEEDDHEIDGCMQLPQPGSAGEPQDWYDAVVATKGGNEKSIVVLSLVGPAMDQTCPPLDKCTGGIDGAEVATRILDFTSRFTYGFVGPVCEPYGPFFSEAISVIKSACDEFDPIG